MITKTTLFKKILISTLSLLVLFSLIFNVYQHKTIAAERKNNLDMAEYYIEEHELTYSNVFAMAGSTEMMEYIKNPNHLSDIIEGIQLAEFYYVAASKYKDFVSGGSIRSHNLILYGYLSELRAYRTFLISNNNESYEDINQIATDIKDLQIISSWLFEKYNNNDFEVYSDKEFYEDVYVKLKSNVKDYYS